MNKKSIKIFGLALIIIVTLVMLIVFYVDFFIRIKILSYRLVIIFLTLILLSNLSAKILVNYFKHN